MTGASSSHGHYGGYGSYSGYWGYATEDHERIEPTLLPDEWIAYSGLDVVALPLGTLGTFTRSERAALLKWVHTGGTLVVYEVGEPAEKSQELARLLELNQHAALSPDWQPADRAARKLIHIVDADELTASYGGSYGAMAPKEATSTGGEQPAEPEAAMTRKYASSGPIALKRSPIGT